LKKNLLVVCDAM